MNKKKIFNKIINCFLKKKFTEKFIIIHASLLALRLNDIQIEQFLKLIVNKLATKFTIIMPSFNFHFPNNKWSYNYSKSEMGIMSEIFRRKYSHLRTLHPIHSVSIYGKESNLIPLSFSELSFGPKSFWAWACNRKDVLNLSLGLKLKNGATFLHYSEEFLKVPYRKMINLKIKSLDINNKKIKKTFKYFKRKQKFSFDLIDKWSFVESELFKLKILKMKKVNNFFFCYMNTQKATKFLVKKISNNPYYCYTYKKKCL